jgi:hypothetical protein
MQKLLTIAVLCVPLSFLTTHAAQAGGLVVGVNLYDEVYLSQADQDAEIQRLVESGVKTIRVGLGWNTYRFIVEAYKHGITTDAIVYTSINSKAKPKGNGAGVPLSEVDPQDFINWFKINLGRVEDGGVRLAAIEFDNEINTARFNGDIAKPGSGRTLGLSDLNNPQDPEARPIVAGYRVYLRVGAALKDMRDHSKLNQTTPILSGASGDWGSPGPKSWNRELGVGVSDSIEFLRQNGLDKMVDGYGVHVYPNGNPSMPISGPRNTRISQLEKDVFAACTQGTKPCWLTEWGFDNPSQTCPIDDRARSQAIQAERTAFKGFVKQGRLAAIIYYVWSAPPQKRDDKAVFRCGSLTNAGKLALSPLN